MDGWKFGLRYQMGYKRFGVGVKRKNLVQILMIKSLVKRIKMVVL